MKYFLVAGEPSGDLHGSNLMRGLLESDPEAQFRFWGGDAMASVGGAQALLKHYTESSFFGVVEVLKNLKTISAQLEECKASIAEWRPDAVILIDYPGFNMKIARFAKESGLKVFYYIAPKVWASREGRIKAMRRYIDHLFIIFPFEQEWFAERGIKPHFCGNPLTDALSATIGHLPSNEQFISAENLGERPIVALLSGSRKSEIMSNLPLMVDTMRSLPAYQGVVAGVEWIDKSIYDKILKDSDIKIVYDKTYSLVRSAEAAIVCSGTATLETALLGTPQVVLYRVRAILKLLRPFIIHTKYISLVNINLGREVVREVVQVSNNKKETLNSLKEILKGGSGRSKMLKDYKQLSTIIGESGASGRFASKMVEILKAEK